MGSPARKGIVCLMRFIVPLSFCAASIFLAWHVNPQLVGPTCISGRCVIAAIELLL